jgi:CBS domain-containing protein
MSDSVRGMECLVDKGSGRGTAIAEENPAAMRIHEIMTPAPQVIAPGDPASSAAALMRDLDVGMIPVCDGERLVGMVTDRDIAIRLVAEGLDPSTTTVDRVMTREVLYCFHDESTEYAAAMMEDHQVRRLVVLDRDKRLVGIVSLGDLATRMYAPEVIAETLEEISEPTAR